jgi:uncharacterized UPF0160 family protein
VRDDPRLVPRVRRPHQLHQPLRERHRLSRVASTRSRGFDSIRVTTRVASRAPTRSNPRARVARRARRVARARTARRARFLFAVRGVRASTRADAASRRVARRVDAAVRESRRSRAAREPTSPRPARARRDARDARDGAREFLSRGSRRRARAGRRDGDAAAHRARIARASRVRDARHCAPRDVSRVDPTDARADGRRARRRARRGRTTSAARVIARVARARGASARGARDGRRRAATTRAMTNEAKRTKAQTTIATHDGAFHCDEALGCHLLRRTRAFAGAAIDRSRDGERWAKADVVIDVGAVYDAEKRLYDHHQREFAETFGRGFGTKLSSAGLVYKHYGEEIVREALTRAKRGEAPDEKTVEKIYVKMYEEFIEGVDAIDNGVNMYDTDAKAKYKDNTGLSARVKRLNPAWDEPNSPEKQMEQFEKAVALTGGEFDDVLEYYASKWLPARSHVESALDKAKSVHESGEILYLETFCPWKEHLYELEAERQMTTLPKFVLWQDPKGFRVSTISLSPSSFEFRKGLPTAWRGLRDDDLSKASGIPGCVFIHAAGFIGGNATYDGALAMAVAGLQMD